MERGLAVRLRQNIRESRARSVKVLGEFRDTDRPGAGFTLLYVVSGRIELGFGALDRSLELTATNAVIVGPDMCGRISCEADVESELYLLYFSVMGAGTDSAAAVRGLPCRTQVANPEAFLDFFRHYQRESASMRPCPDVLNCLASVLLSLVTEANAVDFECGGLASCRSSEVVATKVDSFIASNFNRDIFTTDIATQLRYNNEYLERTYRKVRGITITNAIQRRRVHEACALLADSRGLPVAEVARLCGYRDPTLFGRAFKRIMGSTPTRFREREGGGVE